MSRRGKIEMEDSPVTYIELTTHPGDVFPNPESDAEQEADIAAYFDVLSAALHKAFPKAEIIIIMNETSGDRKARSSGMLMRRKRTRRWRTTTRKTVLSS